MFGGRATPRSRADNFGGTPTFVMAIRSPAACLGDGLKALVLRGRRQGSWPHEGTTLHGRGFNLRVGPAAEAAEWVSEGTSSNMRIRAASDRVCNLDLDHGRCALDNSVNVWGTLEKPEWAQRFVLQPDGTLSPVSSVSGELVLGVAIEDEEDPHCKPVVLVRRSDEARRLIFGGAAHAQAMEAHRAAEAALASCLPACLPGKAALLMILRAPVCAAFGPGRKALVVDGPTHSVEFVDGSGAARQGRGCQLRVGVAREACELLLDGDASSGCSLRRADDAVMRLDIDHNKRVVGNPVNLWGTVGQPDWGVEWLLKPDGTLGPTWPSQVRVASRAAASHSRIP